MRRTDTVLELRESPALVVLILGAFGLGGTLVLVREGESLLAVGFVLLVLALAAAFASTTTCRFDRASGELACSRRTVRGTTQTSHPLAEIVGVRTERSGAQQSQAHRIVLAMASGASVPLTTHFTSGAAEHERTAQAIREFLGLSAPAEVKVPGFRDLFRVAIAGEADALGSDDEALAQHEERVCRAPDDVDARRQLATALALRGRPAEARAHLLHARDVATGAGRHDVASELAEMIRRLDAAASPR